YVGSRNLVQRSYPFGFRQYLRQSPARLFPTLCVLERVPFELSLLRKEKDTYIGLSRSRLQLARNHEAIATVVSLAAKNHNSGSPVPRPWRKTFCDSMRNVTPGVFHQL